jgi:Uma2 family endonuclease
LVLAWRLDEAGEHGKVAKAFPELRTTFAGASRVPDIAVYRRDRLPLDANGKIANVFTVPPDIAIEIVSPERRFNAVMRHCLWYVTHGVQVALLVDPDDESVLAFRPDGLPVVWMGADRIDVSEVIPDFDLTAEQLFASLYPAS